MPGYPAGTATLVTLADGTTSLCTSTGGGIIGGGGHARVAAASRSFLAVVEDHLGLMSPDLDSDVADAPEDDLGHGRHPLSTVFYAGHDVLTELRTMDEAQRTDG
jgi:hypothetical protein